MYSIKLLSFFPIEGIIWRKSQSEQICRFAHLYRLIVALEDLSQSILIE